MKKRIYYYHTDCGGVVYYAAYLEFLEEARSEYLERRGISIKQLAEGGTAFVVSRQEIDYKSPAFYADILDIGTRLIGISKARLEFGYEIRNQDNRLVGAARTVLACVGADFKPKSIPDEIRSKLS